MHSCTLISEKKAIQNVLDNNKFYLHHRSTANCFKKLFIILVTSIDLLLGKLTNKNSTGKMLPKSNTEKQPLQQYRNKRKLGDRYAN